MKEQLYTIPVTDAFNSNCECPICVMKKTLEINAIEYTVGPSYMEDDVRAKTDEVGFCEKHVGMLYNQQNRLGLAMILKTHLDKTNKDLETLSNRAAKLSSPSLFRKKEEVKEVSLYIRSLNNSCFICNKIEATFDRYIVTILHLYNNEPDFKKSFLSSKGICTTHYGILYEQASKYLSGATLKEFIIELNNLYLENMKRLKDELEWFIDKFDYRYTNEPWKNSKDALLRTILKTNGVTIDND